MYIQPDSTIEFYTTEFDKDFANTIFWGDLHNGTSNYADVSARQRQYFNAKVGYEIDGNSYLRSGNNYVDVQATISVLQYFNYMGFSNLNYEKIWYYAFIDRFEYINNNTTRVWYTIDPMQTWFTRCQIENAFIIRAHTADDFPGKYTIEEDVGLGNKLVYRVLDPCTEIAENFVCVCVSLFKKDGSTQAPVSYINGVYQGLAYLVFSSISEFQSYITKMTDNGNINDIISAFMFPENLINSDGSSPTLTKEILLPWAMSNGYVPKNKKLLTYPYNFVEIINNEGGVAAYKYELFRAQDDPYAADAHIEFNIDASLSGTPSIGISPVGYGIDAKGVTDPYWSRPNYSEMLTLQNFPQCAWAIDTFRAYCALNQNTMSNFYNTQIPLMRAHAAVGSVGAGIGAVGDILRLNVGGAAQKAVSGTFELIDTEAQISAKMAQYADLELRPPQAAGNVASSITASVQKKTFEIRQKSINLEHAQMIDQYFENFGYKILQSGKPDLIARPYWTYVKMDNITITGDAPADQIDNIKRILKNGIRLWNSWSHYMDFSMDNHEGIPSSHWQQWQ